MSLLLLLLLFPLYNNDYKNGECNLLVTFLPTGFLLPDYSRDCVIKAASVFLKKHLKKTSFKSNTVENEDKTDVSPSSN